MATAQLAINPDGNIQYLRPDTIQYINQQPNRTIPNGANAFINSSETMITVDEYQAVRELQNIGDVCKFMLCTLGLNTILITIIINIPYLLIHIILLLLEYNAISKYKRIDLIYYAVYNFIFCLVFTTYILITKSDSGSQLMIISNLFITSMYIRLLTTLIKKIIILENLIYV